MAALSRRLRSILEWIDTPVLADIGCDHGYLCIESVLENRAEKAYACDINEGPLSSAESNIKKAGLQDRISVRLQNGLENLPEDVTGVVMAGMGGTLIADLLRDWTEHAGGRSSGLSFLLSPHKDAAELRTRMTALGFHIRKEKVVSDGHFYPVIEAVYLPGEDRQTLTFFETEYGRSAVRNPEYRAFLEQELQKWERIGRQLPAEKKELCSRKTEAIRQELQTF